jgi:hypothetical protein
MNLVITGVAASARMPVRRMDLYIDGLFATNLLALSPRTGNEVTTTYNGSNRTYTVPASADAYAVATGLAARLNEAPGQGIKARAYGDRVEIVQTNLGVAGATNTLAVEAGIGSATQLTLVAWTPCANLLETIYPAREAVTLTGTPLPGDEVRAVVTRLDGVVITNRFVVTTNETSRFQVLSNLFALVNADTNLMGVEGCRMDHLFGQPPFGVLDSEAWFVARTNTWEGVGLFLDYQVLPTNGSTLAGPNFTDNFNDNGGVLGARANVFLAAGLATAVVSHAQDTAWLPDGPHELMVVAEDGTGVAAQRRVTIPVTVDNNGIVCAVDRPLGGQHFARGASVTVDVTATTSAGTITQVALWVEGKVLAFTSAPPYAWTWMTTNFGAGSIGVQAQAFDSLGQSALSDVHRVILFSDDDGDGASDQWEYEHLGSATNYDGVADPDADGVNNRDEYLADTQPTNGGSRLAVASIARTNGAIELTFPSRTTRHYRVGLNDSALAGGGSWQPASNGYFAVAGGATPWTDDPTNAPASTNNIRFYRVEAVVP